jgi:hypothetical protein
MRPGAPVRRQDGSGREGTAGASGRGRRQGQAAGAGGVGARLWQDAVSYDLRFEI